MKRNPNSVRTFESCTEFGACSTAVKDLRLTLRKFGKQFNIGSISPKLVALFRRHAIINQGILGKRSVFISKAKTNLENLLLSGNPQYSSIFNYNLILSPPADNEDAFNAQLTIPAFSTAEFLKPPKGSTHFFITFGLFTISDLKYSENSYRKYIPFDRQNHCLYTSQRSDNFSIRQVKIQDIKLSLSLNLHDFDPANTTAFAVIGITYTQKQGNNYISMQANNTLIIKSESTSNITKTKTKSKNKHKTTTEFNPHSLPLECFKWISIDNLLNHRSTKPLYEQGKIKPNVPFILFSDS
ncbi:MAG: hypothetical protein Q8880_05500 [Bacteroidota bacterium]|nr:hypothetical protein [Bacteroidota bacterium]